MRIRLAFCVVLVVAVVGPATSHATTPGTNGKIAFTRDLGYPNKEIFVVNPDGSGETNLSNHPESDFAPAWSPDGQWIAFISDRGLYPYNQYPDLWIMNPDGTDQRKLTPFASGVSWIEWFPDGSRILFHASRCTGDPLPCGVTSVSPEGGDFAEFATHDLGFNVTWSPYGEPLADSSVGSTFETAIRTINPDGSGQSVLSSGQGPSYNGSLDWSPDGGKLVFPGSRLRTVDWPSGEVRDVPGAIVGDKPTWSPDGSRFAFGAGTGITTVRTDGTGAIQVTEGQDTDPDWQTLDPQPVPQGYARPKAADMLKVFLVPAYRECQSAQANRTHGPSLEYPSCSPPEPLSQYITMGTPDANGAPAKFLGWVGFRTLRGNPSTTADEADVEIQASLVDVRCRHNVVEDPDTQGFPCRTGVMSDYTGELQIVTTIRITDKPPSGPRTGTAQDMTLRVNMPCTSTADELLGGTCEVSTTLDSLIPGAVGEGRRGVWSFDPVQVHDTGIDGEADTLWNNELFATQGIFVP